MRRWLATLCLSMVFPISAAPCSGIDRSLTAAQQHAWAPFIAHQLHVSAVDVLKLFRAGSWHIIYIDTHQFDNGFLFYRDTPSRSRYITVWAGSAQADEGAAIDQWVRTNVPGIPANLAQCFAWYVTQDRGG